MDPIRATEHSYETEWTRRWERDYRLSRWVERGGRFYPRPAPVVVRVVGTIGGARAEPAIAAVPPVAPTTLRVGDQPWPP